MPSCWDLNSQRGTDLHCSAQLGSRQLPQFWGWGAECEHSIVHQTFWCASTLKHLVECHNYLRRLCSARVQGTVHGREAVTTSHCEKG